MAHEKQRHAGIFCCERQLAAGHKIIGFGFALKLHKDGSQGPAAGSVQPGLQQTVYLGQPDQRDGIGRQAEFHKARRINITRLAVQRLVAGPEDGCLLLSALTSKPQGKARGGCGIHGAGINLVQTCPGGGSHGESLL